MGRTEVARSKLFLQSHLDGLICRIALGRRGDSARLESPPV